MDWIYNDGGRSKYYKRVAQGDCVIRAIAIATNQDYLQVQKDIKKIIRKEKSQYKSNIDVGLFRHTYDKYFKEIGWNWYFTANTMRVNDFEHIEGTFILSLPNHFVACQNGILFDTFDSSKNNPMVYGFFSKKDLTN
jgi:hypothetical protein